MQRGHLDPKVVLCTDESAGYQQSFGEKDYWHKDQIPIWLFVIPLRSVKQRQKFLSKLFDAQLSWITHESGHVKRQRAAEYRE